MKNKTTAGLLALFFGWLGLHRFYLGQVGWGIFYFIFFWFSWILGIIDAIVFFSMEENEFDRKYNKAYGPQANYQRRHQRTKMPPPVSRNPSANELQHTYKINGIKKYKEFDLEGAIDDFKQGLEIQPRDVSLHFNIACAYSLTEQVDKAYHHLDKAVSLGFDDYEKIKTHDDLAYVRIQERFEEFQRNGFRLQRVEPPLLKESKAEEIKDDLLLAQLKRLSELRDRGLLSEQEFIIEKKKLTR